MCPLDNHCGKTPDCCSYNEADPTETFTLEHTYQAYRNCSGRTTCSDIQAPWQVINTTTGAPSSYVQLVYVCDNVGGKMNQLYYLAIFIPIGVAITLFVIFFMWCYHKMTSSNHSMTSKQRKKSEISRLFQGGPSPMDEIIKRENGTLHPFRNGSRPGSLYSVGKPVYAVVPNRNSEPQSVNPYSQPMRYVPYPRPVSTGLQDDGGNAPVKRVSYTRLRDSQTTPMTNGGPGGNDGPVSNPAFALTQSTKDLSDVYDPSNSSPESTTLDHEKSKPESVLNKNKMLKDGAVTIHVPG